MGMPMIIGAGVGALGSAAMGKSPFTGALLGGTLGGLGGAGGLFGGASATSAGGFVPEVAAATTPAMGTVAPSILGTPTLNASLLGSEIASPLATASNLGGILPAQSMMDKVGGYITNLPSNAMDYAKANPITTGKMALDLVEPTPQQPIQPSMGQISRPNFDPSSTLINVAPNVLPTVGSKKGLIDMMAHIPMSDEERMRLQQLGYRG